MNNSGLVDVTLISSKPHIRFPKFTYAEEKFLGELMLELNAGSNLPT